MSKQRNWTLEVTRAKDSPEVVDRHFEPWGLVHREHGHTIETNLDDAALIAAAPRLLAACEIALARLEFDVDDGEYDCTCAGDDLCELHRLRSVIAEARWGHKRGDDGGCFAAALAAVRQWGGVLEHPAWSDAWAAHGITAPLRQGGWHLVEQRDGFGVAGGANLWTCHVEQGRYGHPAKKATWLLACLPAYVKPPSLVWGSSAGQHSTAWVSWCGNHTRGMPPRPRVGKAAAAATPIPFRNILLDMARSCEVRT